VDLTSVHYLYLFIIWIFFVRTSILSCNSYSRWSSLSYENINHVSATKSCDLVCARIGWHRQLPCFFFQGILVLQHRHFQLPAFVISCACRNFSTLSDICSVHGIKKILSVCSHQKGSIKELILFTKRQLCCEQLLYIERGCEN
jgi:hypothetical protein